MAALIAYICLQGAGPVTEFIDFHSSAVCESRLQFEITIQHGQLSLAYYTVIFTVAEESGGLFFIVSP